MSPPIQRGLLLFLFQVVGLKEKVVEQNHTHNQNNNPSKAKIY